MWFYLGATGDPSPTKSAHCASHIIRLQAPL